MNIKPYILLIRPANIVTAFSDILAGVAIASIAQNSIIDISNGFGLIFLLLSTLFLYGGGIAFNDVCDAELDTLERPERPIPSGQITKGAALIYVIVLFILGIFFAFLHDSISGLIAIFIMACAVIYDKYGKHHSLLGPINMGLCRGGNLMLGISILPLAVESWLSISLLPVLYIAAVTIISRGEVHGGHKKMMIFSAILYGGVHLSQLVIAWSIGYLWLALPFVLLHIYFIFSPLLKAIQSPLPSNIGRAVKHGVLGLIVMNAAWASVSGNYILALIILALLPLSIQLSKYFAVT
ncbi:UbiA-like protein EboC [Membranihabitans marinus]|uniref:UbiA-like protein EboC n=1 Tax=Membranihabitans marinus TaxID=1227546 RepID=UPI001F4919FC|nr:UbiA-like protein EboC [Membranihabitans marinus]